MTLKPPPPSGKSAPRRAVPGLQTASPMRFALLTGALIAASASAARAQSNPFSCTGMNAPTADFTLSVDRSETDFTTIAPTQIENVLDIAECQCNSMDLFVRARVTKGLTQTPLPTFSVWVGNNCIPSNRGTICEQVLNNAIPVSAFQQGGNGGTPRQQVPVQALISPNTGNNPDTAHMCLMGAVSNFIWFLFGDPNMPDNCNVRLDYFGTPPPTPTGVTAGSGDGAVTLKWDVVPAGTNNAPKRYQILCSTADGDVVRDPATHQPVFGAYAFGETPKNNQVKLGYSTCIDPANHIIQRQVLNTTSSVATGTDGGVISVDMAAAAPGLPEQVTAGGGTATPQGDPIAPQGDPADGGAANPVCNPDTADGGADITFKNLDKSFVCSDILDSTTTSHRVDKLQNNVAYNFSVVAIDNWGNPAPSTVVCALPQPVQDLYRRFLSEGGKPQGFCFIATAAFGSYQSPFVMILRDFRDRVLAPTPTGASFIAWYYRTSPPIADWIRPRPWARFAVRTALWPVIVGAGLWMWLGPIEWLALGLLAFALVYTSWMRRAIRRRERGAAEVASLEPAGSGA
jgi:hypothetical protein